MPNIILYAYSTKLMVSVRNKNIVDVLYFIILKELSKSNRKSKYQDIHEPPPGSHDGLKRLLSAPRYAPNFPIP